VPQSAERRQCMERPNQNHTAQQQKKECLRTWQ